MPCLWKGKNMRTKYEAKRLLIDKGIGFWTKHKVHGWCVRIAGCFYHGDIVTVMANGGIMRQVTLGESIPSTRFSWLNSSGQPIAGQLFKAA